MKAERLKYPSAKKRLPTLAARRNLGERIMPARLLNHSVFLRELMPQDLKLEIDQLTRDEAVSAARYLAVAHEAAYLEHCRAYSLA